MRSLTFAALALALAACGAYQFPGSTPSPASSAVVSGTVLAVPCSPVEKIGDSCAGRPVPNLEIDYKVAAGITAKAFTDQRGRYAIELPAGSYTVALNTYMRVISGPTKLSLARGSQTEADYLLDNGIRVPVPQQ